MSINHINWRQWILDSFPLSHKENESFQTEGDNLHKHFSCIVTQGGLIAAIKREVCVEDFCELPVSVVFCLQCQLFAAGSVLYQRLGLQKGYGDLFDKIFLGGRDIQPPFQHSLCIIFSLPQNFYFAICRTELKRESIRCAKQSVT